MYKWSQTCGICKFIFNLDFKYIMFLGKININFLRKEYEIVTFYTCVANPLMFHDKSCKILSSAKCIKIFTNLTKKITTFSCITNRGISLQLVHSSFVLNVYGALRIWETTTKAHCAQHYLSMDWFEESHLAGCKHAI